MGNPKCYLESIRRERDPRDVQKQASHHHRLLTGRAIELKRCEGKEMDLIRKHDADFGMRVHNETIKEEQRAELERESHRTLPDFREKIFQAFHGVQIAMEQPSQPYHKKDEMDH